MFSKPIFFCAYMTISCFPIHADDGAPQSQMVAVSNPQGVTILDGIQPVLTYQRAMRSQDGKWPRANYVHPLYNLDGEVITEDFPVDHGHHRGIFWAWHQVLVDDKPSGDAWVCLDFEWDVQEVTVQTTDKQATLTATTLWKTPAPTDDTGQLRACVQEQTTIVVHRADALVRWLDFNIELLALMENVRIAGSDDEKGYGGFSPRIKLSDNSTFLGTTGPIEPQVRAISAGPWVDIADDQGGVVIITHRDNPGFPQPWILRRAHSMQNAVYPGRQPIALSRTDALRLRYRLGVHRGELSSQQIDAFQEKYNTTR